MSEPIKTSQRGAGQCFRTQTRDDTRSRFEPTLLYDQKNPEAINIKACQVGIRLVIDDLEVWGVQNGIGTGHHSRRKVKI